MITLNTEQHLKGLLILSRYTTFLLSHRFLFYYLFSNSHAQQKHHAYNLYRISYTLSF